MSIYISIVSHSHDEIINNLSCVKSLSKFFNVIIKSNKSGDDFFDLLKEDNVHWINDNYGLGFGANNNLIFSYCREKLKMKPDDFFIILNPDVYIKRDNIITLIDFMSDFNNKIACINLFKNNSFTEYDNSVRKFPSLYQFVKSFLGFTNDSIINKALIFKPTIIDWAAGSFLAFEVAHYENINGFDENYFMYCEDIDICYRSNKQGYPVVYYPQVKALHYAKHENRKLFSKHLYWHISSVFRFLLTKKGLTKPSSSLVD